MIVSGAAVAVGTMLATASGDPDLDYLALFALAGALAGIGFLACVVRLIPARLPRMTTTTSGAAGAGQPREINLRATVDASRSLISNQFATAGSVDAQLVGFVAALAAGLGVFALATHSLRSDRLILLGGAVVALLASLSGLFLTGELKSGPDPAELYTARGSEDSVTYLALLVSSLAVAITANKAAIQRRRNALGLTIVILGGAAAAWGIVRLVV